MVVACVGLSYGVNFVVGTESLRTVQKVRAAVGDDPAGCHLLVFAL